MQYSVQMFCKHGNNRSHNATHSTSQMTLWQITFNSKYEKKKKNKEIVKIFRMLQFKYLNYIFKCLK